MKYNFMKKGLVCLFLTLLMTVSPLQFVYGQDDIDQQRMDRDLRIMESALEELFRIDNRSSAIRFSPRSTAISGSWLPGFGVILTIPDRTRPGFFGISVGNGERPAVQFQNPLDGDREISEESVQNRITEFLTNYAPSIGQLESDDKVLVVYGDRFAGARSAIFFGDGITIHTDERNRRSDPAETSEHLPIISMVVTRQDLDDLRTGRINPDEFANRISSAVQPRDGKDRKVDLQVFASVLETGLNENRDEVLRLVGKPAHLYLDNFGAIYQLNLRPSAGNFLRNFNIRIREDFSDQFEHLNNLQFNINPSSFEIDSLHFNIDLGHLGELNDTEELREAREKIREEMEKARHQIERAREAYKDQLPEIQRQQEEVRREIRDNRHELNEEMERKREELMSPENMRESLENQLQIIRELIVDYGRTLSSLDSNHSLFLIVRVQHSEEELPQRIDLRIDKDDLLQLERGQITREQAINRIVERRF